ncbi:MULTISPECIES: SMI1/KNR4 family protein [unclassified Streptomyces]|uniref:SMI1/KNR4 family protein n=1 Tax=unclassified Streptomyces TaxID=2593676 RepID=UPI002E28308B|nr:SMI1/KNR4 family protein [Streptomyces sp. NBC_00223]
MVGERDGVRERVLALRPEPRGSRLRRLLRCEAVPRLAPLLDDLLTERQVAEAEWHFGVSFPTEYRDFLREVGAGGFGPGTYGLDSLARRDSVWGWSESGAPDPVGPLLARPFPTDEERACWTRQLDDLEDAARAAGEDGGDAAVRTAAAFRAAEDELYPAMTAGAIRLGHEGCGYYTWLVVTGEERGNLWSDPRASDQPLVPLGGERGGRTGFAEWYLTWLQETAPEAFPRALTP